jgi:hypothetical protein
MLAYAQFFATHRSVEPKEPALVPVGSFTAEEQHEYEQFRDELFKLHTAASGTDSELEAPPAPRSWYFTGSGPVTLICGEVSSKMAPAMANPSNPNYTELLSFADLDALMELHGHVRAENPGMDVFFKSSPNVVPDDLTGHVVLIGGIWWNSRTRELLDLASLPVTQRGDPRDEHGEIFVVDDSGKEKEYLAAWSPADPNKLLADVGLLVRMPNPLNSSRTLTMCNGIHSRGVLGAVRSLTDARLRDSNENYIARNFPNNELFGMLIRVRVMGGRALTPDFNTEGTVLYKWPAET